MNETSPPLTPMKVMVALVMLPLAGFAGVLAFASAIGVVVW
jgi:hypothetical protein